MPPGTEGALVGYRREDIEGQMVSREDQNRMRGSFEMEILVVDDEVDQVETLKRGLRRKGHKVLETTQAQEALNWLQNRDGIEMVITDYLMPVMNGIELLEQIRKNYPTLPVIMMTAYGQKDLLVGALRNSCNGYIEKPFTLEQLMEEIERVKAEASRLTSSSDSHDALPMLIHQINNPLMAINGTAELAMLASSDQVAVETYMTRIIEAVGSLNAFNKKLLDRSRRYAKHIEMVDVNRIIEDSLVMFKDLLTAKQIQVVRSFSASEVFVSGNKFDFEQLFKNLILNSIEAMEDQEERLLEAKVELSEDSLWVQVTIGDTGRGIPEELKPKIFDSYVTGKSSGTGLGLAVVRKAVEEHRGKVEVESEVGKGTKFKVLLPASNSDSVG